MDELTAPLPFAGLRIVDLTDEYGILATRILAGLGADVVRVEPPGGDRLRSMAPTLRTEGGEEIGLYWAHFAAGKRSVVLDLPSEDGCRDLERLISSADVLFESGWLADLDRWGLDWEALHARNPELVYTSVTPFGLDGPRADWLGGDLVAMAAGGLMSLCGDPDRAPLRVAVEQGSAQGALQAMVGTLIALRARKLGAGGQRVDVSMQEAVSNTLGNAHQTWVMDQLVFRRAGGGRATTEAGGTRLVWEASDGYAAWGRRPTEMKLLHQWMTDEGAEPTWDAEEWSRLPVVGRNAPPPERVDPLNAEIAGFFRRYPKMTLYEDGQRRGLMVCPVSTVHDLFENDQLSHREFFREVEHPEAGRALVQPGPPFRMSASGWRTGVPPRLGEHTREVLDALSSDAGDAGDAPTSKGETPQPKQLDSREIFAGLKVADFSWVGVGPMAAQTFAWFGAEVVRVESTYRLDTFRDNTPLAPGEGPDRSGYWANVNRDKYGMTLNLRHPEAREVARRLVERADIVTESFAPGFMAKVGMDYEWVRSVNPRAIMISMSMEGQGGPHLGFKGFGLVLQATAGVTALTGWPDRPPVGTGVAYTDWFATYLAQTSLIAALEHRDRTGEGQYIDLSQLEAMIWGLDDAVIRYSATGEILQPQSNRHRWAAPHSAYQCAGDDRWCAISVFTDEQWRALREALGTPSWADARFDTVEGRKVHEDVLDAEIGAWTADQDSHALAERLQAAGVPAHHVNDARDLDTDVQLVHRGHYWPTEHPVIGPMTWDAPAYRLSATPAYPQRPAPRLGEHNEYVYRELLGYSEEEFVELMVSGATE